MNTKHRFWLAGVGALCLLNAGCYGGKLTLPGQRPPTTPGPLDVQAEMRDARFFLAYPDASSGPPTLMTPRESRVYQGSL